MYGVGGHGRHETACLQQGLTSAAFCTSVFTGPLGYAQRRERLQVTTQTHIHAVRQTHTERQTNNV